MSALVSNVNKNELPAGFFKFMVYTRFAYILMQVFFNHVVPDHKSDGFQSPYKSVPLNYSSLDSAIDFLFSGYARWDGQYFLHIATLGYTHENCLAFFPAYPFLLRFIAQIISFITFNKLIEWNSILLSSIIINVTCFFVAAKFLYSITVKLFKSPEFAFQTWKVFCISPVTIFFLAPYTESLFSALTFTAATRSNGLVNLGFLLYFGAQAALTTKWKSLPALVGATIVSVVVATIPFLCYQYYAFRLFCFQHSNDFPVEILNYLINQNLTIPGERIPKWCGQTIPFSYSVIQSQYWDVGFLRYFTWKQIPNFLLASPVLILIVLYSLIYAKENIHIVLRPKSSNKKQIRPIFRRDIGVFAAHSMFLGLFTFFFAHVQISTRLIGSSSPAIYWMISWIMDEKLVKSPKSVNASSLTQLWNPLRPQLPTTNGRLVCFYCLSYVVIGTAMFVNHLPWT